MLVLREAPADSFESIGAFHRVLRADPLWTAVRDYRREKRLERRGTAPRRIPGFRREKLDPIRQRDQIMDPWSAILDEDLLLALA
jgi:hypothetical protein